MQGSYGNTRIGINFNEHNNIPNCTTAKYPEAALSGANVIRTFTATFELKGFKKGRFDAFDTSALMQITFEPLKYKIDLNVGNRVQTIPHFYQELLGNDEIHTVAETLTRYFLEVIRKKTSSKP